MKPVKCFDIETTGLDASDSFRIGGSSEIGGSQKGAEPVALEREASGFCRSLCDFLDEGGFICGHNAYAFDIPFLARETRKADPGLSARFVSRIAESPERVLDTLVLARLLRGQPERGNSMDSWIGFLAGLGNKKVKKKVEIENWKEAGDGAIERRVSADVENQAEIYKHMAQVAGANFERHRVYQKIAPFMGFLAESLSLGLPLFLDRADAVKGSLMAALGGLAAELRDFYGAGPDAWASNFKINEIFKKKYGKGLKLGEETPKTRKRNPLFNKDLEFSIVADFPGSEKIFEYRAARDQLVFLNPGKKKSILNPRCLSGGSCYPRSGALNQNLLRSSYSAPPANQMSSPIKRMVGKEGWRVVGGDVKGLELNILGRILADKHGEPSLFNELASGECPKQKTIEVYTRFGGLFREIPEDLRKDRAKRINYAAVYGQGMGSALKTLQLPETRENYDNLAKAREARLPGQQKFLRELLRHYTPPQGNSVYGTLVNFYGLEVRCVPWGLSNGECQSTGAVFSYMLLGRWYQLCRKALEGARALFCNHDEIAMLVKDAGDDGLLLKKAEACAEEACRDFMENGLGPLWSKINVSVDENLGDVH